MEKKCWCSSSFRTHTHANKFYPVRIGDWVERFVQVTDHPDPWHPQHLTHPTLTPPSWPDKHQPALCHPSASPIWCLESTMAINTDRSSTSDVPRMAVTWCACHNWRRWRDRTSSDSAVLPTDSAEHLKSHFQGKKTEETIFSPILQVSIVTAAHSG